MTGALTGLKVLDLSRYIAGPYCGMLLGDMGADVIKVETPEKGENTRAFVPRIGDSSVYTMIFNRNKRGMTLNFRSPEGQKVLKELIQSADVVIENFLPGTLEKMGCGWEEMRKTNPRLIMTRISGFGASGPYAKEPCFDLIAQAMSGLMDLTGQPDGPPTMAGSFIADYTTALYATIGIMGALQSREKTGLGQLVETTLLGSAMSLLVTAIPNYMVLGKQTKRNGNRDRFVAPSNTFPTKGGDWVIFQASTEEKFAFLAAAMGRADLTEDPRFATNAARLENVVELEDIISAWSSTQTTEAMLAVMSAGRIPGTKVATVEDVVNNPQVAHNEQIIWADQGGHKVPMQGFTVKFSDTPMQLRHPTPAIGEHTAEVLQDWLDYSAADVDRLQDSRAV
jgi:crotonobetainyl-CoA:carnitine CoA-transferase CaiB-like acyl-CoA transferase